MCERNTYIDAAHLYRSGVHLCVINKWQQKDLLCCVCVCGWVFFFFSPTIQDGRECLKIVPTQKHSHPRALSQNWLHLAPQQRTKELMNLKAPRARPSPPAAGPTHILNHVPKLAPAAFIPRATPRPGTGT